MPNTQLLGLSQKDGLSGILNRRGGEEKVSDILKMNAGGMFCLLDADKFKKINDTYGHGAGDLVIKKVASSLVKASRAGDDFLSIYERVDKALYNSKAIEVCSIYIK